MINKINGIALILIIFICNINILLSILNCIKNNNIYNYIMLFILSIYELIVTIYSITIAYKNMENMDIIYNIIMIMYSMINIFTSISLFIYYKFNNSYVNAIIPLCIINLIIFILLTIYNRDNCRRFYYIKI